VAGRAYRHLLNCLSLRARDGNKFASPDGRGRASECGAGEGRQRKIPLPAASSLRGHTKAQDMDIYEVSAKYPHTALTDRPVRRPGAPRGRLSRLQARDGWCRVED